MHAEGLGQLRDVASIFAEQFAASRIAHAEVQTAAAAEALQAAEAAAAAGQHPMPARSAFAEQARVFAGGRERQRVVWLYVCVCVVSTS